MKSGRFSIIASFVLTVSLAASLSAKPVQFAISLHGTEKLSSHQYTIRFGHDPQATACLDTALGERYYPPPPPTFFISWKNPGGLNSSCYPAYMGPLDLRNSFTGRTDTFRILINSEDVFLNSANDTITLTWSDVNGLYTGPVTMLYLDDAGTHSLDMKLTNILALVPGRFATNGFNPNIRIYAGVNPGPGGDVPLLDGYWIAAAVLALLVVGAFRLRTRRKENLCG